MIQYNNVGGAQIGTTRDTVRKKNGIIKKVIKKKIYYNDEVTVVHNHNWMDKQGNLRLAGRCERTKLDKESIKLLALPNEKPAQTIKRIERFCTKRLIQYDRQNGFHRWFKNSSQAKIEFANNAEPIIVSVLQPLKRLPLDEQIESNIAHNRRKYGNTNSSYRPKF